MPSVKVHGHIREVKLSDRVLYALDVGSFSIGALGDAQVCHEVGQGIGFY